MTEEERDDIAVKAKRVRNKIKHVWKDEPKRTHPIVEAKTVPKSPDVNVTVGGVAPKSKRVKRTIHKVDA